MRIGRERRTKETNTKIQRCLDALNILERDQESITHEFSEMQRCTHSILKDTGWDDNFFDLLEPPAHWLRTRPIVVCLYRMMLLRPGLHSLFLAWSRRCGYTASTDITELRVYHFLECVWKTAIHTVASSEKPLPSIAMLVDSTAAPAWSLPPPPA